MNLPHHIFALPLALLVLGVASASAAAPVGPRLAVQVSHPYPQLSEVETVAPDGGSPARLVGGVGEGVTRPNGGRPSWSPDGSLLAFTGSFGELGPVIYVVDAEGGEPQLVSKTAPTSDPVFMADGRSLAFSALRVIKGHLERGAGVQGRRSGVVVDWAILAVDLSDGAVRRLTPWRRQERLTPTSFSPDGSELAAEREDARGTAAVAIDLENGKTKVLARDAEEPVYSPDGSHIAFIRTRFSRPSEPGGNRPPASSELFVIGGGGRPTKLVDAKGGLAWPSWDPSGTRLTYTRLGGGSFGGTADPHEGTSVMEINADGSCVTRLLTISRGIFYGSAWQPGLGREAGPIVCSGTASPR